MVKKSAVHSACMELLTKRLSLLSEEMQSLQSSSDEETKSSAGDKYETTREMIQAEKEKLSGRLDETHKFQHILASIHPEEEHTSVKSGSLVQTEKGWMFLSISLGAVEVDGVKIFVISPVAPIGQAMLGKKLGQTFSLNNNSQTILSLV